jgi:hypothetical protein
MTNHAEIVKRLRAVYTKTDRRFGEFEGDCINPDGPEAAALIEALAERVRELEGALEPFARFAEMADADGQLWIDGSSIAEVTTGALRHVVSYGDLRRARQARKDQDNE